MKHQKDDGIPIRSSRTRRASSGRTSVLAIPMLPLLAVIAPVSFLVMVGVGTLFAGAAIKAERESGVSHEVTRSMFQLIVLLGYAGLVATATVGAISWAYFGTASRAARVATIAGIIGLLFSVSGQCLTAMAIGR